MGSLNQDIFLKVKRLPQIGETIAANAVERAYGGKGANAAVAASRLGGTVTMLGQVGNDGDGQGYVSYLQKEEKVEISGVKVLEGIPTGQAFIMSQADGDNSIVINGGANMAYTDEELSQ